MYYNLTTEQKYILTLSDTMLKEGYTVDEVIEFLQCEDMDQVECILGTLTLTESVDVDHPDLELVLERVRALTSIGSWLARQAGKLKGAFGRGASGASKTKINLTPPRTTKIKSTNPRGPGKKLRGKKVTGDVTPNLRDKVKTGLKIAAGAGAAVLVGTGIENAMKDGEPKQKTKDGERVTDSSTTSSTTGGGAKEDGLSKGYGSRTRAYGWWKKSHASQPYVDTDHFKNIRAKQKGSEN